MDGDISESVRNRLIDTYLLNHPCVREEEVVITQEGRASTIKEVLEDLSKSRDNIYYECLDSIDSSRQLVESMFGLGREEFSREEKDLCLTYLANQEEISRGLSVKMHKAEKELERHSMIKEPDAGRISAWRRNKIYERRLGLQHEIYRKEHLLSGMFREYACEFIRNHYGGIKNSASWHASPPLAGTVILKLEKERYSVPAPAKEESINGLERAVNELEKHLKARRKQHCRIKRIIEIISEKIE